MPGNCGRCETDARHPGAARHGRTGTFFDRGRRSRFSSFQPSVRRPGHPDPADNQSRTIRSLLCRICPGTVEGARPTLDIRARQGMAGRGRFSIGAVGRDFLVSNHPFGPTFPFPPLPFPSDRRACEDPDVPAPGDSPSPAPSSCLQSFEGRRGRFLVRGHRSGLSHANRGQPACLRPAPAPERRHRRRHPHRLTGVDA